MIKIKVATRQPIEDENHWSYPLSELDYLHEKEENDAIFLLYNGRLYETDGKGRQMDFNKYCRFCGQQVKEITSENEMLQYIQGRLFKCECVDRPLNYKEVIAGHTLDARVSQLQAMHQLMLEANDESIYMSWIYTVPDYPSEDDFKEIAMDDKSYNECFDKFVRLIAKEGNRY